MNATMKIEAPAGMIEVTQKQFHAILNADKRDIMPTPFPEYSVWKTTYHGEVFGRTTPGYRSDGPDQYFVVASLVK